MHPSSAVVIGLWAAAVIATGLGIAMTTSPSNAAGGSTSSTVFPGRVASLPGGRGVVPQVSAVSAGTPALHLQLDVSSLDAVLAVPGTSTGTVSLLGAVVPSSGLCSASFQLTADDPVQWSLTGGQADAPGSTPAGDSGRLGVAMTMTPDGRFVSSFLTALRAHRGPRGVAFTIMQRAQSLAVIAGVPSGPCFAWNWAPLAPVPGGAGLYAVALVPSFDQPWTLAIFDVGRWLSVLPGSAAGADYTLQSSAATNVGFYLQAGTTTSVPPTGLPAAAQTALSAPSSSCCILGLSALARGTAFALDVSAQRAGVLATRIGDVFTNAAAYRYG